jgi:hypothetical protein
MNIMHRKCGERVYVMDSLQVTVLSISPIAVSFTICDTSPEVSAQTLSRPLADACKNKSCYFWFPHGGRCVLVAHCNIGRNGVALGASRLQFLGIYGDRARIAVEGAQRGLAEETSDGDGKVLTASAGMPRRSLSQPHLKNVPSDSTPPLPFRWRLTPRLLMGQFVAILAAIAHR